MITLNEFITNIALTTEANTDLVNTLAIGFNLDHTDLKRQLTRIALQACTDGDSAKAVWIEKLIVVIEQA